MSIKAVALISGGLDSTLATKLILEQGIEVHALNTISPFCTCDRKRGRKAGCRHEASYVAKKLGIELKIINVSLDLINIIKHPKYGFGSNMNPCIDCRILTFKKAKEYMQEIEASFIITGEVVGQRPMSQRRHIINLIEREADLEGLVLRPLSARLLPSAIPEKKSWVDREKLLSISGRSRREQMSLAERFGVNDYPCSAGGCLLTDRGFSSRIKDLIAYNELTLENVELLKVGRHFRIDSVKVIIGRNERENRTLELSRRNDDYLFMPSDSVAGPISLARGRINSELMRFICGMVASYCDLSEGQSADMEVILPSGEKQIISVFPLNREEFQEYRI